MSVSIIANSMSTPSTGSHLEAHDIAAYVDHAVSAALRDRVERHIADCRACRDEVFEVSALTSRRHSAPRRAWNVAAGIAAAAVIVVVAWPAGRTPSPATVHREAPIAATIAPRPIVPVGSTHDATTLVWSSVPNADGYVVSVFNARGDVVWEDETSDTTALAADSAIRVGQSYFWRVEARTGFGRRTAGDLVEFQRRRP
jgi:hypothetical protein